MNRQYPGVAERAGHRCEYCHASEAAFNFPFEVEHVLARAAGGSDHPSNLALACRSCNVHKGGAAEAMDAVTGLVTRRFDPRADVWADHFDVGHDGVILGRTAAGRATVDPLRVNSASQLAARHGWRRLGLFP